MSTEPPVPATAPAPSTADISNTSSTSTSAPKSAAGPIDSSPNPPLKSETAAQPCAAADSSKKPIPAATTSTSHHPSGSLSSDSPDFATIPSYSKWFQWDKIYKCEVRLMPEFFDGKSLSKNPNVYKYYRNAIVKKFRENPSKKITFTEVRRTLVGDVGSIRRVFDFLETWGLINYSPSGKQPVRWEEKEGMSGAAAAGGRVNDANAVESVVVNGERSNKLCSTCKTLCSIACFASSKHGLVLCARCYVRGNYRVGVNKSEFRRVEISEQAKTDWTDKETLHLLEAITHYGDDWMRVAEHVSGRTEKECVARFIKLPFGEQLVEPADPGEDDSIQQLKDQSIAESSAKRMCIMPLADASNPIMAQAAFLSALAGVDVAEAAAQAAVTAVYGLDNGQSRASFQSQSIATRGQEPGTASVDGSTLHAVGEAQADAESLIRKEEDDLERTVSSIAEAQMQEIHDKITHYEEMELQLEKEWEQFHQMKHQLFLDQLAFSFHMAAAPKSGVSTVVEGVEPE